MTFNWVDYVFLAIFIISAVGGLLRGGVREIISLITWIAAFVIAGLFAKPLALAFSSSDSAQSAITQASSGVANMATSGQVSMLALGVSFTALFFGTILVGALIGFLLNRVVEGAGISIFNRLFGVVFGLGRGYLISLLIVFIVQLSPVSEQAYWLESSMVKTFQPAVKWLADKVQPNMESFKSKMGQTLDKITSGVENAVMPDQNAADNR